MRSLFIFLFLAASVSLFAGLPYAWVEMGPEGGMVRVITSDKNRPVIKVNGVDTNMTARVRQSPKDFAVFVWELPIPRNAKSLKFGEQALPVPTNDPQNIVVLGDTGCRLKDNTIQDCTGKGDGEPWRWAEVAAAAAAKKPDLIIHVGDYLYREMPCPPGNKNCEGSPYGDNWATWEADFFNPVGDLLGAAPWIFTRGNHEDCSRAWKGWFLFLDPIDVNTKTFQQCPQHPEPYVVGYKDINVAVIDTSVVPHAYSSTPDKKTVAILAKQLEEVNHMTEGKPSWTATHRPYWGMSSYTDNGVVKLSALSTTLRAALKKMGGLAPNIELALAGHIHQFELLRFDDGRPPQVIAGAGGTYLDPPITEELIKANPDVMATLKLAKYHTADNFNFLMIKPGEKTWNMTLFNYEGKAEGRYSTPRK